MCIYNKTPLTQHTRTHQLWTKLRIKGIERKKNPNCDRVKRKRRNHHARTSVTRYEKVLQLSVVHFPLRDGLWTSSLGKKMGTCTIQANRPLYNTYTLALFWNWRPGGISKMLGSAGLEPVLRLTKSFRILCARQQILQSLRFVTPHGEKSRRRIIITSWYPTGFSLHFCRILRVTWTTVERWKDMMSHDIKWRGAVGLTEPWFPALHGASN